MQWYKIVELVLVSNSAGVIIFGGVLEQNGKGIQASSKRGLKAKPPLKLSTKVIDLEVQKHFFNFYRVLYFCCQHVPTHEFNSLGCPM